jgi:PAS domain S-box-containing protein
VNFASGGSDGLRHFPRRSNMEVQIERPAEEIKRLQRCINDLISVLALPAMWTGQEPAQIVGRLLDVMLGMLRLDFAYARLKDPFGEGAIEEVRVAQPQRPARPQEIYEALNHGLGDDPQKWPPWVRNPLGDGNSSIVPLPLGLQGEIGVIVAGSARPDFPGQTEKLLLSVAANQAVIWLQETRLLNEQRRVARELDERVEQRTRELVRASEELKEEITERRRAEEVVRETEQSFRLVVDGIAGLVAITNAEGAVEFVNNQGLDYFGKTLEELKNWATSDAVHPDDLARVVGAWRHSVETGAPYDGEHRLRRADGTYRWFQMRGLCLRAAGGRITRWYVLLTDVDERKQAERALAKSEERWRAVFESSTVGVALTDMNGRFIATNSAYQRMLGYTEEELRKLTFLELTHADFRESNWQQVERLKKGTESQFEIEKQYRRKDGSLIWVRNSVSLVPGSDLVPRFVMALSEDITERKRAEEKLRRSEADLLEAQRLTHVGSWKHDISSGKVTVSPEIHRMFGSSADEDTSSSEFWFGRIHPEDRQRVQELFQKSQIEKSDYQVEYRVVLPDGTIKYHHSLGRSILNKSGDLVEFVGTAMDVTEQVQARTALEKAFAEINALKDQLYKENLALRDEVNRVSMFEDIVGTSRALQTVLARISKVAPTDSTVLITGETGTGKELVARAIHRRSRRSSRAFVSVNCVAIPRDLVAADLFGHEKGAFTGATQRRLGRFELAEGGTLFLDEVGDLPADTQVALLRVLQEHEFERVGGTQSIRTDVRVIAATNRDLQAAIDAGAFRSDLFYRLNVFPIHIPPLRERREDIPLLVEYFIDRYARKARKVIRGISRSSLDRLQSYDWLGNIRELQNVVERSVILCETENFSVDESWLSREIAASEPRHAFELSERITSQEKDMIESALRECGGKVFGPSGAAARLGIPRSTLESKIRSLKINKNRFKV